MDKRYHKYLKEKATGKEIESATIFGQKALNYTKKELVALIVWQERQRREKSEQYVSDIKFMLRLNRPGL